MTIGVSEYLEARSWQFAEIREFFSNFGGNVFAWPMKSLSIARTALSALKMKPHLGLVTVSKKHIS